LDLQPSPEVLIIPTEAKFPGLIQVIQLVSPEIFRFLSDNVLILVVKNGKGEKDERRYGFDPSGFLQRPASLLEAKGKMLLY
jgi:hypothetical protein